MPPSRLLTALVLICLLPGCAQLPGATNAEAVRLPYPAREAIGSYFVSGRIALNQGDRHYAVNFTWQHGIASDVILVATPLGQGIAELTRDSRGAHLKTVEQREFNAVDWQALSLQAFGMDLPLSALPRWLLAEIPANALGVRYDGAGRPQQMVTDDWQVAYLGYADDAPDALPSLIEIRREDILVRLKIDDWQLSP